MAKTIANRFYENAKHFHAFGLNITCLTGIGETFYHPYPRNINDRYTKDGIHWDQNTEEIKTEIRFKAPSHPFHNNKRQEFNELEELDWNNAHGLGVVIGFNLSLIHI